MKVSSVLRVIIGISLVAMFVSINPIQQSSGANGSFVVEFSNCRSSVEDILCDFSLFEDGDEGTATCKLNGTCVFDGKSKRFGGECNNPYAPRIGMPTKLIRCDVM
jgi:hypothetical protein